MREKREREGKWERDRGKEKKSKRPLVTCISSVKDLVRFIRCKVKLERKQRHQKKTSKETTMLMPA